MKFVLFRQFLNLEPSCLNNNLDIDKMMNGLKLLPGVAICLVTMLQFPSMAQSDVVIGKEFTIRSSILNEERRYFVRLPVSYENDDNYPDKRYPVLVMLDADSHFYSIGGLIHGMSVSDEEIPEMIIVGVKNTNRSRDMTPSKSENEMTDDRKFRLFIEDELLKVIDDRYRTLPHRVLFGHSLAGSFAMNSFLDGGKFNSYLVIDPSIMPWFLGKTEDVLKNKLDVNAAVYFVRANNPFQDLSKGNERHDVLKKFAATFASGSSLRFRIKTDFFENEDHFSVVTIAVYQGLKFIFEGYKPKLRDLVAKKTPEITDHYHRFHAMMGAQILPPGKLIDQVAEFLIREKRFEQAIELLQVNEQFYPNSFVTYVSLGTVYKMQGRKDEAERYYAKALTIDPGNAGIRTALEELK